MKLEFQLGHWMLQLFQEDLEDDTPAHCHFAFLGLSLTIREFLTLQPLNFIFPYFILTALVFILIFIYPLFSLRSRTLIVSEETILRSFLERITKKKNH